MRFCNIIPAKSGCYGQITASENRFLFADANKFQAEVDCLKWVIWKQQKSGHTLETQGQRKQLVATKVREKTPFTQAHQSV